MRVLANVDKVFLFLSVNCKTFFKALGLLEMIRKSFYISNIYFNTLLNAIMQIAIPEYSTFRSNYICLLHIARRYVCN